MRYGLMLTEFRNFFGEMFLKVFHNKQMNNALLNPDILKRFIV